MKNAQLLENNQLSKPAGKIKLLKQTILKIQCYVITSQQTLIAFGLNENIKIFQFQDELLKELQTINIISAKVLQLQFMHNSNDFISGQLSEDDQIIIWQCHEHEYKWFKTQCLQECSPLGTIKLIINKDNNLLISCHFLSEIKIWKKNQYFEILQTLTLHKKLVNSLSFNEAQNKLVSCGEDSYIVVCELRYKLKKVQRIVTGKSGYQVCFIENDNILFQPWEGSTLEIYSQNKQLYQKINEIHGYEGVSNSYGYFYILYNREFKIILNLNKQSLKVMKIVAENQFVLQQTLDFNTNNFFGTLTEDGSLVTWDDVTQQIQIFKLNYEY